MEAETAAPDLWRWRHRSECGSLYGVVEWATDILAVANLGEQQVEINNV